MKKYLKKQIDSDKLRNKLNLQIEAHYKKSHKSELKQSEKINLSEKDTANESQRKKSIEHSSDDIFKQPNFNVCYYCEQEIDPQSINIKSEQSPTNRTIYSLKILNDSKDESLLESNKNNENIKESSACDKENNNFKVLVLKSRNSVAEYNSKARELKPIKKSTNLRKCLFQSNYCNRLNNTFESF